MNVLGKDNARLSSKELLVNKLYFKESMDWYNENYTMKIVERTFLLYLSIILVLFCIIVFYNINSFAILKLSFPVVKEVEVGGENFIYVARINSGRLLSSQKSLAKYLINSYVVHRESYGIMNPRYQFIYIKNNSSYQMYQNYRNIIDINNINSPLLKYRNGVIRDIFVSEIYFVGKAKLPDEAVINIIAQTKKNGKILQKEKMQINISFALSDINLVNKGSVPLSFIVTDYQEKLLSVE